MARPKKEEHLKMVNVGVTVPPEVEAVLIEIGETEDRTKSYVARELLLRGLAAYRRDKKLKEPAETNEGSTLLKVLKKPARTVGASKARQRRA